VKSKHKTINYKNQIVLNFALYKNIVKKAKFGNDILKQNFTLGIAKQFRKDYVLQLFS
jgi:hypothetical protein